ncbi:hypothetical protein AVEN_168991-1 [Araneus ventricosus]|uniref:Uncharacterized protein n=1 Tax=Araneus ventricosus TaxID=182803 RepID=A0A4Y2KHB0_ARAVE|nr:hypothetical protein AVEN_168991-1 [Araneus ventricosus]
MPAQVSSTSSDHGSKLGGPSQNSPRVASKRDFNITKRLDYRIHIYTNRHTDKPEPGDLAAFLGYDIHMPTDEQIDRFPVDGFRRKFGGLMVRSQLRDLKIACSRPDSTDDQSYMDHLRFYLNVKLPHGHEMPPQESSDHISKL